MDETRLLILPQLPGGEAVALGAGNKRRSFIFYFWGDRGCIHGVYSGTVWWFFFYIWSRLCFGRANFFFPLKCIVESSTLYLLLSFFIYLPHH